MPKVEVQSNIWTYWRAKCPQCEWEANNRQHESDAWTDLQGHMRQNHYGNVTQKKVRRTVQYEELDDNASDEAPPAFTREKESA